MEILPINLNGQQKEYQLTRKNVKNLNLRIKVDGSISISAPIEVELCEIEDFLISKSDYILSNLKKFEELQANLPSPKQYVDGESFYLLGKNIRLKVLKDTKEDVFTDGVFLYLSTKYPDNIKKKEKSINNFFVKKREEYFKDIVDETFKIFSKYGVEYPTVKSRSMSSRWGSCLANKNQIILNKNLIETPRICIEYVVLHEFTHFIHPNHSKDFYNFVSMLMPDWKKRKQYLENFAFRVE